MIINKHMTEKLKNIMEVEILKLPKDNQTAINSIDWGKITEEIGKRFLLTTTEINALQVETGLILINLIDMNTFEDDLENDIGLSINETKSIIEEIFDKVLTPIAESIKLSIKKRVTLENPSWDQTVNFILSGGDYSCFIEEPIKPSVTIKPSTVKSNFSI